MGVLIKESEPFRWEKPKLTSEEIRIQLSALLGNYKKTPYSSEDSGFLMVPEAGSSSLLHYDIKKKASSNLSLINKLPQFGRMALAHVGQHVFIAGGYEGNGVYLSTNRRIRV